MKALLFVLVATAIVLAGTPTIDAAPCNGEPILDLVDCGIGGHRVYVCGKYVTNYCIWGP